MRVRTGHGPKRFHRGGGGKEFKGQGKEEKENEKRPDPTGVRVTGPGRTDDETQHSFSPAHDAVVARPKSAQLGTRTLISRIKKGQKEPSTILSREVGGGTFDGIFTTLGPMIPPVVLPPFFCRFFLPRSFALDTSAKFRRSAAGGGGGRRTQED